MATSPRPYKNQATKNLESKNPFIKPKSMVRSETLAGERKERMKRWITFYRRNPNYLIRDYFGIKLHPFQILMIWVLQRSTLAYIVAARAASKSFIIAIWSLCLAVLYPGIKITVVSKTLKQGGLIVGKIEALIKEYPNIAREIEVATHNSNGSEVKFHCGSHILTVPASESARGEWLPRHMVTCAIVLRKKSGRLKCQSEWKARNGHTQSIGFEIINPRVRNSFFIKG